ncbi:MAG: histidine kinase dimerization/phospho-acceptor domain-containing protein [Xenococcaceae cyanobacterium]
MTKIRNRLFCRLDNFTPAIREQKRLQVLSKLGLLAAETVPVFEEATQTASSFLETPICILGLVVENELWFKSASGLSTIGLMNQLAAHRKIPLMESFSTYVVDSEQPLCIENTLTNPVFASSTLVQHYSIRAYLGVPLISSEGLCVGTLEVMDIEPREFSLRDADFLALTARWCLREFERDSLIKTQGQRTTENNHNLSVIHPVGSNWHTPSVAQKEVLPQSSQKTNSTNSIKVRLLAQLTQELRTPLTSVIGMASVLRREVYGPLTNKQKEYLEIIHNSGQNLISLVDEIVNLGVLSDRDTELQTASTDVEMIAQQVINSLVDVARQQQQKLRLSVEPGNRIWLLDKDKIKQALYYLIISVLEMSEAGGEIRIHISRRNRTTLNIAVWLSHPWLGDGLPPGEIYAQSVTKALALNQNSSQNAFNHSIGNNALIENQVLTSSALITVLDSGEKPTKTSNDKISRDLLGLLLTCHLVEMHGGSVLVQGTPESGYRYILQFPKIESEPE